MLSLKKILVLIMFDSCNQVNLNLSRFAGNKIIDNQICVACEEVT